MSAPRDARFRLGVLALLLLLATFVVPRLRLAQPIDSVVVVMDITTSMTVADTQLDGAPATRLAMEQRAAEALLASLPCGSRLGLAIFVERVPFLLFRPVETCENYAPLAQEIRALDWRMGWDSESHIAIGLRNAIDLARGEAADLIFMTDGQEMPPLWWTGAPDFHAVAGAVGGLVVGVGGTRLSPVPKYDTYGRQIGTWKPGELPAEHPGMFLGHEHLSAVDEPHLRALAGQAGLHYLHLTQPGQLFVALQQAVKRRTRPTEITPRFVPAALALATLLLMQIGWRRARPA